MNIVAAKKLRPGDTVRVPDGTPPRVVLDCWKRAKIVHLVFMTGTAMLRLDAEVVRL